MGFAHILAFLYPPHSKVVVVYVFVVCVCVCVCVCGGGGGGGGGVLVPLHPSVYPSIRPVFSMRSVKIISILGTYDP